MKYFYFILLVLSQCCFADVYQQVDQNGNTTYSDSPMGNSKIINDNGNNTSTVETSKNASLIVLENIRKPYTQLSITSPTDQQTFQNERDIIVQVKVEPDLQKDDKLQLYVDGAPYGDALSSTQLPLTQLDRGEHTIKVVIIGQNKAILKSSATITVYIQYARLGPNNQFGTP